MAPPPEYDKEPKAPDKSANNIPSEDSKALYNLVNEHQTNSDSKSTNSSANAEVENNKHVETLDDGQLRALLDEAITYKCPKDREGKSSLFKELLEEVEQDEQDEQACSAAARLPGGRARRSGGRGRRAMPHSNSLQDLVAALAAEPAPRRARHQHPPAPVSQRAIHGGSLPSGVDTSFLLSEEPMRGVGVSSGGAEYVATVRCVNPSPLAERRVSASDAHCPDADALRRNKPVFPMYTARATLEIGSGSVCSGRAVTTTTASNQVRTHSLPCRQPHEGKRRDPRGPDHRDRGQRDIWDDVSAVDKWYRGLEAYGDRNEHHSGRIDPYTGVNHTDPPTSPLKVATPILNTSRINNNIPVTAKNEAPNFSVDVGKKHTYKMLDVKDVEEAMARKAYRERVGHDLIPPSLLPCNPKNIRSMSIGPSLTFTDKCDPRVSVGRDKPCKDKHYRNSRKNEQNINVTVIADKPVSGLSAMNLRDSGDKNKPVKDIRSNQYSKQENRSFSPQNNYPNVNPKNKIKDRNTTINFKDKSSISIEMLVTKEKSLNDEPKKEIASDLIEMTPAQEKTENNEMKSEKASDLVEVITKDKIQHDTDLFKIDTTQEKNRTDENNVNLVEIISMQSSSEMERSNELSQFIESQHRLLQSIESSNDVEDKDAEEVRSPDIETAENNDRSREVEILVDAQTENPFKMTVERALDRIDDTDSEQGTEMVDMKRADRPSDPLPAELPANASYFLTLYKRLLTSPCKIDNAVDIKPTNESKPMLAAVDNAAKPLKKKKEKITARLSRKPHNENSTKRKDIIRNALKKLFFDNITQSDSKCATTGAAAAKEVDSAIPFSCITTPEVVASCTTTASAQAAVPVDPKPLQLLSSYRAVSSLTGGCEVRPVPVTPDPIQQPQLKPARSMVSSAFNGMQMSRAGPAFSAAAAVAQAAAEEFKKSLDENGNSVQGFSSPQSGSGQQKKQRRKKSSKNETVIKSHHIDGYQGNKDLNEVLRFIESNEPERPKRHDDKKKRSAERRKDKAPRASSLDDLSRGPPPPPRPQRQANPAPKPERRSWGDERQAFYFRDPNPEPDPEPTDFQTVTKKRKPRRRADEPSLPRQRPRAPSPRSPPSPRARSERSNDSTDDLDSVHSLPALPSRAPPASYADIARTKHNIPDLIESCNYYGEGDSAGAGAPAPAGPGDADGYPALDPPPRRREPGPGPARRPDVLAHRRPAVVLLDEARAQDLDGVTFGFDVNEQLLGGGVAVRAGRAALRYVPPAPPPDDRHLHQIVDYVGAAWEDVVRCGGGKVRYFSE